MRVTRGVCCIKRSQSREVNSQVGQDKKQETLLVGPRDLSRSENRIRYSIFTWAQKLTVSQSGLAHQTKKIEIIKIALLRSNDNSKSPCSQSCGKANSRTSRRRISHGTRETTVMKKYSYKRAEGVKLSWVSWVEVAAAAAAEDCRQWWMASACMLAKALRMRDVSRSNSRLY